MARLVVIFAAIALLSHAVLRAAPLVTPHDDRLSAWRAAGEYAAAEQYCRQQLERTSLTNAERHALTLELAQLALEHALRTPSADAEPLWQAARETARNYADQYANNPRRAQLYAQSGLAYLAEGETLLAIHGEAAEPPRVTLREAIKLFRRARELTEAETRQSPRGARREVLAGAIAPWDFAELRSTDRNLRYELGRALRRQAESYPAGSEDRALAASQAAELFGALSELADTEPLAWPSRVQLIGCERLQSHWDAAAMAIARCEMDSFPASERGVLRAERLRLALAREDVDGAMRIALQPDDQGRERALEEDLALLEVQLAAAERAAADKDQETARRHSAEASRRVRIIGERWGVFWGDIAAARLARQLTSGNATADYQAWSQAGDALYQQGQADQALAAYDQARQQSSDAGDLDAALLLGMKGAAVEQARERFAQAAERFRVAAIAHPRSPRAADAHYAAIYNLASSGADEAAQVPWLEEHLEHWPNASSASPVRIALAESHARDTDFRVAIELLAKVDAQEPLAATAVRTARDVYQRWLAPLPPGVERRQVVDSALRHFATYQQPSAAGEAAGSAALIAAIAEAELLICERQSYAAAEAAIATALRTAEAKHTERAAAEAWRLAAQALQPDQAAAAHDALSNLPKTPGETLEAIYVALEALPVEVDPASARQLAVFQLELIQRRQAGLKADDLPAQRTWELRRATVLAAAGRAEEAIQQLRKLRGASPEDVAVTTTLGRLLAESKDANILREALECWRAVERATAAGTTEWFEAKYQLAELHHRLGDNPRAAKIIQLTRTLHPELGGATWKGRFEALLEQCQSATRNELERIP
ncbi:MAG: hypothetical protein SGJ19_13720 [Planctomycetia bacterium]|nr:hypothetical protein [Planctomycetia bacterium]